ncbi:MAG: hypothetical protein ACLR0U_17515 [Enterocloster clostridioformis]
MLQAFIFPYKTKEQQHFVPAINTQPFSAFFPGYITEFKRIISGMDRSDDTGPPESSEANPLHLSLTGQ